MYERYDGVKQQTGQVRNDFYRIARIQCLVVSIWQSFIELCEEKEIDNVFVNTPITTFFFRN
jgi:hypothetical protein